MDEDPTLQAAFKDLTGKSWEEDWDWLDNIKHLFPGGIFIMIASIFIILNTPFKILLEDGRLIMVLIVEQK